MWLVLPCAFVMACGFTTSGITIDARPDTPPDMPPVTWTVDPVSDKATPASAAEWTDFLAAKNLTVPPPDGLWLVQDASGALADSIGNVSLGPTGTVGYQLSVPGWNRLAVGTADNAVSYFSNSTSTTLPDVGFSSMTVLMLFSVPTAPPATRSLLFGGSSSPTAFARVDIDASRHFRLTINTTSATGMQEHGMTPMALILKLDRGTSQQKIITKLETIAIPYTPLANSRGLFLGGADFHAPDARWLYVAAWYGSKAEISDPQAASLLTALDW